MIQYNIFPNGKRKALTFSYDDGPKSDMRLIELFNKYGVKGTFHLNGIKYRGLTESELNDFATLYKGYEISCHTLRHGFPTQMPEISLVNETLGDREILEKIAGYPVKGMSYPYGDYDDNVINILKACGIVYSRTTRSTGNFKLPQNFLEWHPTCHHGGALALCDTFLEKGGLFYIWGHSFEFNTEEKWRLEEELLEKLSGREKEIWYASNIDIYDYITAQRSLKISANEKIITNPSAIDVWVEKDKSDIVRIPSGETVTL